MKHRLIEFRKLNIDDDSNNIYADGNAWSRPYEYQWVYNHLCNLLTPDAHIHNTCWGYEGVHVKFKELLDCLYKNTVHSDILPSSLPKTFVMDITNVLGDEYTEKYDAVINVSAIEEINFDHLTIFTNLLKQVKVGGYLFITFDIIPGYVGINSINIEAIESYLNVKIIDYAAANLNGGNSTYSNKLYTHLNCGALALQKL